MKIKIGKETLDTETMNVTVERTTYHPSITIDPVNPPKDDYSILLKTTDPYVDYYYGNILKRSYVDPELIPDFTKIVFRIDDEENPKRYEIQISDIWNGGGESFLWYPFGGGKNSETDFHLEIQIDIPLISKLYSMFKQSDLKNLGLNYYMITKLLDRQQAILRTDLYMSSPPIQDLFSVENYVTLIFSRYPVFFQHKTQEQSSLNFCQAAIDLENKERNLIYEVKLPEKNSCDFYQNFIHLANESKKDDDYSFRYFYILLQKKTA